MYFLTYVSSATRDFASEQLLALLATCERNNRRDAVTGMLLYKNGNFMQVLEGEEASVVAIQARIVTDPRHSGLITLLQGEQCHRQFPDWSMGFENLDTTSPRPAGYSEFLDAPLTGQEFAATPTRAQKLLLSFKKAA